MQPGLVILAVWKLELLSHRKEPNQAVSTTKEVNSVSNMRRCCIAGVEISKVFLLSVSKEEL